MHGSFPPSERSPFAETFFHSFIYVENFISQNLRSFVLLEVYRSFDCYNPVRLAYGRTPLVYIRENNHFTDAVKILQVNKCHHFAALCDKGLLSGNHSADYATHSVTENRILPVMGILFRVGNIVTGDG